MKTIAKNLILMLVILFIAVSCKKEESPSREIKIEVTGNFKGTVDGKTTTDGISEFNITKLPYTNEMKRYSTTSSQKIGVVLAGSGGTAGETVVVKIYVDGVLKKEAVVPTANDGSIIGVTETDVTF